MRFNNTELTQSSIEVAIEYYIDNAVKCIIEAHMGVFYVNDLTAWAAWHCAIIEGYLDRVGYDNLAFRQYAYYVQTGVSVALLP